MLALLRKLLRKHGYLNYDLIDNSKEMPCSATYAHRFGSLTRAYKLIGFKAGKHNSLGIWKPLGRMSTRALLDGLKKLLRKHGRLSCDIINNATGIPSHATFQDRFGSLTKAYRLIGYTQSLKRPKRALRSRARKGGRRHSVIAGADSL
jgi:hypothetical protein